MGEVYRAHDERLQRDVAIKVLPPSSVGDSAARSRLLREARAAAALNHPHICTVFEVGEESDQAFIAMELVEGQTLDTLIPVGGLPLAQGLKYGVQIADAVAHAHERGILHRDLKAANVMVTPAGRTKVLDFGLAKHLDAASSADVTGSAPSSLTQAGAVMGTLSYMAPEVLRGQPADARSDVWALGVILYELASGQRPFAGQTPFEISAAILNGPPTALPDSVPRNLRMVIERCLAKSPGERYPHAGELRAALEAIEPGAGTLPATSKTAARSRLSGARLTAAAIVAVALLALLAFDIWGVRRWLASFGTRVEAIAVLPFDAVPGTDGTDYLHVADGVQDALSTELARVPGIARVIARGSTRRVAAAGKTIPEIARALGVTTVVMGAVKPVGNRVEITARVIDAGTEREIWAGTLDSDESGLPVVQRDIVRSIASALGFEIASEHQARLASAADIDARTYEAYLRGMSLLHKGTPPDRIKGLGYLREATDRDPGNAHAWAGLALGYVTIGHGPVATADVWANARAAAERAIKLDGDLATPHMALAAVKMYWDFDWPGAEVEYRRANELNPSFAENRYHYAWYLVTLDRVEEAVVEHRRAQELDPLTPVHTAWLGGLYSAIGRHDEALVEAKKAIELDERVPIGWLVLGWSHFAQGRHADAVAAHERAAQLGPRWKFELARTYSLVGRRSDAEKILAELEALPPTPFGAFGLGTLQTTLGNFDEAFRWFAYEPHHGFLPWVRTGPQYAPLVKDPRYAALLQRLKLPPRKNAS